MNRWLQRLSLFFFVAALVGGGLAWATVSSLDMEAQRRESRAKEEQSKELRLALWRLDGKMAPFLAREDSRPYAHFTPLHAPVPVLTDRMQIEEPGKIRLPSPLLEAELPDWMGMHFQIDERTGWASPQVIPESLAMRLRWPPSSLTLPNVTIERAELLQYLASKYPHDALLADVKKRARMPSMVEPPEVWTNNSMNFQQQVGNAANGPPAQQQLDGRSQASQSNNDAYQRSRMTTRGGKGADSFVDLDSITTSKAISCEIHSVKLSPMFPMWMPSAEQPEHLLFVRLARAGPRDVLQGVVIDWPLLREELTDSVKDLFADVTLSALPDGAPADPERIMTALPIQIEPCQAPAPAPPSIPLRIGLGLAWAATFVALLAIALGGWSLIDLSERRIRFVSAVTHELRTPLTTLRLYLDMLTSGMVRDDKQRDDYLATLTTESERLHRLIGNVLDFARLEKQQAKVDAQPIPAADLLEQVRSTWQDRCDKAGKTLVVENSLPPEAVVNTDGALVQQIVGNLIDNACKYSASAEDRRVWMRARQESGQFVIEVEDCGPGVSPRERSAIFRPFRRGHSADVIAGGVGLGLALARRWAQVLGGHIEVCKGACAGGACFRLELPL